MFIRMALLLSLFAPPVVADDAIDSKPEILVLTTGGTIASRTDAPLIEGNGKGET